MQGWQLGGREAVGEQKAETQTGEGLLGLREKQRS